jgi:hypothetical protein
MSGLRTIAVYHLVPPRRMPADRLMYVEDGPGSVVDVYLDSRHMRGRLVWELNWMGRHQDWSHHEPTQSALGLCPAAARWELVPADAMPGGHCVVPIQQGGGRVWLLRDDQCTSALRDAVNGALGCIACGEPSRAALV